MVGSDRNDDARLRLSEEQRVEANGGDALGARRWLPACGLGPIGRCVVIGSGALTRRGSGG